MEPASKRARRDSTSSGDVDNAQQDDCTSKPKQHDSLWFDDGNVVLATDVHLYRVHKGVLARNSTIFKDMFELPCVGGSSDAMSESNGDSWEGMPLVRMVGDSDEDVYHLLMVFYDFGFYIPHKPTTLGIIVSVLRMSTKYGIPTLRQNIINHIGQAFPRSLEDYEHQDVRSLLLQSPEHADFKLLSIARECDARTLLPALYLECAILEVKDILQATSTFEWHEQVKIISGHEALNKLMYEFAFKLFAPQRACRVTACATSRGKLLNKYMAFESYHKPYFPIYRLLQKRRPNFNEDKEDRASICKECSEKLKEAFDAFRSRVWDEIPQIFELGSWEDVWRD